MSISFHMEKDHQIYSNKCEKLILCACLFWIFVNLDSFFIWNRFENILRMIAAIGVFFSSIVLSRYHLLCLTNRTFLPLVSIFLYYLWHTMSMDDNVFKLIGRSFSFVPLLLIICWPKNMLFNIYKYFRVIIIFFAVGSFFVSILTFIGLIDHIPFFVLGPRSALHERMGVEYHVYGLFVTNYGAAEIFPRACGMLQEPGHFSIILGFVYMTDRLLKRKPSIWIILCGIMTFSSTFVLLVSVTEIFRITTKRQVWLLLKAIVCTLFLITIAYFSLSKDWQEQINYLAYERNLKDVVAAGSLNEALDERINSSGDAVLRNINSSNIWTGLHMNDDDVILSDYRGVIVKSGLIGLLLLVMAGVFTVRGVSFRIKCSLLFFLALVLIHRSWMYGSAYIFFLSFMATSAVLFSTLNTQSVVLKKN